MKKLNNSFIYAVQAQVKRVPQSGTANCVKPRTWTVVLVMWFDGELNVWYHLVT